MEGTALEAVLFYVEKEKTAAIWGRHGSLVA